MLIEVVSMVAFEHLHEVVKLPSKFKVTTHQGQIEARILLINLT